MNEHRECTSTEEESCDESTTEAENNYSESFTPGILAFPAPLRLQSLLFIIGHLDEYENETLALLPPRTRRVLLLNLPAIDVCKLEGSEVTEAIDMEEIWKALYYNRLPLTCQKKFERFFTTVDDMQELTWKDCYFTSLFGQFSSKCDCNFGEHMHEDLLYGIYNFDGTLEVQECFGPHSGSCFGVEPYTHHCCRLAPMRYIHQFSCHPFRIFPKTKILYAIPTLVEVCKFEVKAFSATDKALNHYFDDKCLTDNYFPYWKLFLGSVHCLRIAHDEKELHPGWKNRSWMLSFVALTE